MSKSIGEGQPLRSAVIVSCHMAELLQDPSAVEIQVIFFWKSVTQLFWAVASSSREPNARIGVAPMLCLWNFNLLACNLPCFSNADMRWFDDGSRKMS